MFLGHYTLPVNAKDRIRLPEKFLGALSGGAIIAQGFERNLVVFPTPAFEELYQQVTSLNITNPLSRLLLRLTLGTAVDGTLDAHSSLAIPAELKNFAEIKDEVIIVGQGNYFEIWTPETWAMQRNRLDDADENSYRFAELSLSQA